MTEPLSLGPLKIPPMKERQIIIVSAIIGILIFILALRKKKSATAYTGSDLPITYGGGMGSGSESVSGSEIVRLNAELAKAQFELAHGTTAFSFDIDTGTSFSAGASKGKTGSSSSGLSIGQGISNFFGFGKSGSSSKSQMGGFSNEQRNRLTGSVFIGGSNADDELQQFFDFFTGIGGTFDERMAAQIAHDRYNRQITDEFLTGAVLTDIRLRQQKELERLARETGSSNIRPIGPPVSVGGSGHKRWIRNVGYVEDRPVTNSTR